MNVVSEWLLLNVNSAIVQLYHGENKLVFNKMMMRCALYWTNTLSWVFFIVLAHWDNSPRVDMSLHSDTLFWFPANQYLLFFLCPLFLGYNVVSKVTFSWICSCSQTVYFVVHLANDAKETTRIQWGWFPWVSNLYNILTMFR